MTMTTILPADLITYISFFFSSAADVLSFALICKRHYNLILSAIKDKSNNTSRKLLRLFTKRNVRYAEESAFVRLVSELPNWQLHGTSQIWHFDDGQADELAEIVESKFDEIDKDAQQKIIRKIQRYGELTSDCEYYFGQKFGYKNMYDECGRVHQRKRYSEHEKEIFDMIEVSKDDWFPSLIDRVYWKNGDRSQWSISELWHSTTNGHDPGIRASLTERAGDSAAGTVRTWDNYGTQAWKYEINEQGGVLEERWSRYTGKRSVRMRLRLDDQCAEADEDIVSRIWASPVFLMADGEEEHWCSSTGVKIYSCYWKSGKAVKAEMWDRNSAIRVSFRVFSSNDGLDETHLQWCGITGEPVPALEPLDPDYHCEGFKQVMFKP